MRVVALTRLVATRLLSVVVFAVALVLAAASVAPASAAPAVSAAPRAGLEPGDLVVADQSTGEVLRVTSSGETEALLSDLESVRGVLVLADGSILAADSDAGAIVGTGGRFGGDRVEVAAGLRAPEALALAADDQIYVSSFSEGTLSRVDLGTGQIETLSAGLEGPSAVLALRPPRAADRVAVAEWFGGAVVLLRPNGDRGATLVDTLERPAGLATDGDGTIFVTDRDAGTVVAIDQEGQTSVVAEVARPGGITLDPAQPASGQSFELVVATGDGVQRIDPESGATSTAADVARAVGVAVAPDEFITPGASPDDSVVEGAGGSAGGDVVAAQGNDIDYTLVGLVALSVVLAGVAIVTGVQLVRSRGDEEEGAPVSRKERRRAEQADKAVQAAERKTAREVLKAEKRAAKLAPPEPPAAEPSPAAPPPASPLFLGDPAPDAGMAPVPPPAAVGPPPSKRAERAAARQSAADAKAAARQAAADDKAAAAAAAAQAKEDGKLADARAKAEAKQAKAQAKVDAEQARTDAAAAAAQAKVDAAAAKAQAKADAKGGKGGKGGKGLQPGAPHPAAILPAGGSDAPGDAALLAAGLAAVTPDAAVELPPVAPPPVSEEPDAAAPPSPARIGAEDARQPLFASPAPPHTPGPFLESLFTPADSSVAGADAAPRPADGGGAVPEPLRPPRLADPSPVVPAPTPRRPLALPESTSTGSVTDLVARSVAPPHGVFGRRKAKRRHRAAEHRHQQLRAITSITDVPPVAAPPSQQPGAIELAERGIAPAASVALPRDPAAPSAIEAGSVDPGSVDPD